MMMSSAKRTAINVTAALSFILSCPAAAVEMEEIVVKAQKRDENAQEVPISLVAINKEQLQRLRIAQLQEVTETVPGVEIYDERGSSQPTWVIRGVGLADFNVNNTPTATIYYDDFHQPANLMGGIGIFDIESVEILKGPQSGLYGRNTTGGAVLINTTKPSFEPYAGYVNGWFGEWQRYGIEAAIGGQLSDRVAFRIAAMTEQGGGWQDSLTTSTDDKHGDRDYKSLRAQLLVGLSDNAELLVKLEMGSDASETTLGSAIGTYDPFTGDFCAAIRDGRQDNDTCITWANLTNLALGAPIGLLPNQQSDNGERVLSNPINAIDDDWFGVTARLDWDFGAMSLVSISGYVDYENNQVFDFGAGQLNTGHEFNNTPIESWSQELRLVSDDSGQWSWIAGLVVANDTLEPTGTFTFPDNILIFGGVPSSDHGYRQENDTWSMYGQLVNEISDRWRVEVGMHYTNEKKELRGGYTTLNVPGNTQFFIQNIDKDYKLDTNWSSRVAASYRSSDNVMYYGSITSGHKSGGFFGGFALSEDELEPYLEESVTAAELGFKSDLLDGSLRLNGAVFYYDFKDVQGPQTIFSPITGTALVKIGNIGDAEHKGIELDAQWIPSAIEGLSLAARVSFVEAELKAPASSFFLSQDLQVIQHNGLERDFAPDWSYYLQGRYDWFIGQNLRAAVQIDFSSRDDITHPGVWGNPVDSAVLKHDGYDLLQARVDLARSDDRWRVSLVGKNLTNEAYLNRATFDNLGSYQHMYARPRSWFVEFGLVWP
jgi:iron complex outermembrane receptor protein